MVRILGREDRRVNRMKIVIFVPNKSNYVSAWCLEYFLQMRDFEHLVSVVDLSNLDARYKSLFRWLFDNLYFKNSVLKVLKKVSKKQLAAVPGFIPPLALRRKFEPSDDKNYIAALKSTYSSEFGRSDFQISQLSLQTLKASINSFKYAEILTEKIIQDLTPELVVTVNGRFLVDAAVLNVCRRSDVQYKVLENTSESNEFFSVLSVNSQFCPEVQSLVSQVWEERGKYELLNDANLFNAKIDKWFASKNGNFEKSTGNHSVNSMYATFFPTSDYEFSAFDPGVLKKDEFSTQAAAFKAFVKFAHLRGLKVRVRVHPHVEGSLLQGVEDDLWFRLCKETDAELISSISGVNSYKLAEDSRVNGVFSSTIGAELLWQGIPTIILGNTTYSHLLPQFCAFTETKLFEIKLDKLIREKADRGQLIPWAYYLSTGHIKMTHVKLISADEIYYENRQLIEVRKIFSFFRRIRARNKYI